MAGAATMNLWRWLPGRQGTGYRKMLLAQGRTWDLYVLDYPPGSGVPFHYDPVAGRRHYRLNVTLFGDPGRFVRLLYPWAPAVSWWRFALFRPDVVFHAVAPADERRVVLSLGWVR